MPTENETLLNIETEVNNILNDLDLFTKLEKVEDFMNEKYNVSITNDAEITKGYVTYVANITNADELPVEGALVRFEKANGELLAETVTDSSGNASIDVQQDIDIYELIANVKNTPYADNKMMYINEPMNLLPLNVWAGTAVSHDTTGFTAGAGAYTSSSREWSTLGDASLEIIKRANSGFTVYAKSNEFMGLTTLTCKFDILTPDGQLICRLGTDNYINITSTTVSASDEVQTIIISATVPPGETVGRISFLPQNDNVSYFIDNISMVGNSNSNVFFYDPGTTGTSADWRNWNQNGTRTPSATGTTLACTGTNNYMVFANAYGTSGGVYDYNAPYTVEFDVVSQTDSPSFQIYDNDSTNNFEVSISQTGHYKFTYEDGTMNWWIGETQQTAQTIALANARIGFRIQPGKSVKFKEFMIYKEEGD